MLIFHISSLEKYFVFDTSAGVCVGVCVRKVMMFSLLQLKMSNLTGAAKF